MRPSQKGGFFFFIYTLKAGRVSSLQRSYAWHNFPSFDGTSQGCLYGDWYIFYSNKRLDNKEEVACTFGTGSFFSHLQSQGNSFGKVRDIKIFFLQLYFFVKFVYNFLFFY
jgi:hypothetical protein